MPTGACPMSSWGSVTVSLGGQGWQVGLGICSALVLALEVKIIAEVLDFSHLITNQETEEKSLLISLPISRHRH